MTIRIVLCAVAFLFSPLNLAWAQNGESIEPARLEAARRVIVATRTEELFLRGVDRMIPLILNPLAQARGLTASQRDEVGRVVSEEVRRDPGPLIDMLAVVYAQRMTTEDLIATAEFYESPVGVRMLDTLPRMEEDMAAVADRWAQEVVIPRVIQRLQSPAENPSGPT